MWNKSINIYVHVYSAVWKKIKKNKNEQDWKAKISGINTPTRHGVKVVLKAEEVRANPGHPRKWVKNPIPIQWINEKKMKLINNLIRSTLN